jgi:hypothetical protein
VKWCSGPVRIRRGVGACINSSEREAPERCSNRKFRVPFSNVTPTRLKRISPHQGNDGADIQI